MRGLGFPARHRVTMINRVGNTSSLRGGPHPLWAAPLAVVVTFLLVGCYTILKHPITADGDASEEASHQEYYRGQCLDCHQDYATYPYGFFYGEYPSYYFDYPRLGYYYAYPWWWDHLWYDNEGDGTSADGEFLDSTDAGQASRKASRRGGMIPPYVEGASPILPSGGGYSTGGSSTSGKTGSGSGTEGAGSTGQSGKTRVKAGSTAPGDSTGTNETKPKSDKKAGRRGGTPP